MENNNEINIREDILKNKRNFNYFKSDWANLKFLLQDKFALEKSIQVLKRSTIDRFAENLIELYSSKIKIYVLSKLNKSLIKNSNNNFQYSLKDLSNLVVREVDQKKDGKRQYNWESYFKNFLGAFREDNSLMYNLVNCMTEEETKLLAPFFCHFFYENYYIESNEQEEMLYIIYLLLEKEIDELIIPCYSSFLVNSFLSIFLSEFLYRSEAKAFLDIVLNDLIRSFEETHVDYCALTLRPYIENKGNINEEKRNNNFNGDIVYGRNCWENEGKFKIKNIEDNINNSSQKNTNYFIPLLDSLLHPDIFVDLSQPSTSSDPILQKAAFILRSKSPKCSVDPREIAFSLSDCKISKKSVDEFNNCIDIVTSFIDKLLFNLENCTIIPYNIRVICKLIYILIKKKFKDLPDIDTNNFVNKFFFNKLILPILLNPDINDVSKNTIITLSTRKTLGNIYIVLKQLSKGELFYNYSVNNSFIAFNPYIIRKYPTIERIIKKICEVSLPKKLEKMCQIFYSTDDFVLKDINEKRFNERFKKLNYYLDKSEDFNYNYFESNKGDLLQQQSICFSYEHIKTILEIVKRNEEIFINTKIDNYSTIFSNFIFAYNNLKLFPSLDSPDNSNSLCFLLSVSSSYDLGVAEFLRAPRRAEPRGDPKKCLVRLLEELEIERGWTWVRKGKGLIDSVRDIDAGLKSHNPPIYLSSSKIPLYFLSSYILENIPKLERIYSSQEDYISLYTEIKKDIEKDTNLLKNLNDFLTVQMTTKSELVKKKIQELNSELSSIRSTEINIKIFNFIERENVNVCLCSGEEINELRYILGIYDSKKYEETKGLIYLSRVDNKYKHIEDDKKENEKCPHFKMEKKYLNSKPYIEYIEHNICKTVHEFACKFSNLYEKNILESISDVNNIYNSTSNKAKNILDSYIQIVKTIYLSYVRNDLEKLNFSADFLSREDYENKVKDTIWNYILKRLLTKIYEKDILKDDIEILKICEELKNTPPEKTDINIEIYDENIFKEIQYRIKQIDYLRTPYKILQDLGNAAKMINSLFMFFLSKNDAGADDFLPVLIFCLIRSSPKHLCAALRTVGVFIGEEGQMSDSGYTLTQFQGAELQIRRMKEEVYSSK